MYRLKPLPYSNEFKSIRIYKYLSDANFSLGELKGLFEETQNFKIILKYICLIEAKNSVDIEGIHTNYRSILLDSIALKKTSTNSAIVINQLRAVNIIFHNLITKSSLEIDDINRIQRLIVPDNFGLRELRGFKVYNKVTSEVIYSPPQNKDAIVEYYKNLVKYINTKRSKYDPLIKMAIIYYQFKCIHPYKDGNGRIGRIIGVMSLIRCNRITYPILNLSKYVYNHRDEYFSLLEKSRNNINFLEEFIIFILKGIHETSDQIINLIRKIDQIIVDTKQVIIDTNPKIYSPELLEHIFLYPFTKNKLVRDNMILSKTTATKYLKILTSTGLLESLSYGKEVIYINKQVMNLFQTN